MFDRLNQLTTELQACISSLQVDCVDAAGARGLVEIADRVRRAGDSLRTVAVGQVERTNAWKGEGARGAIVAPNTETQLLNHATYVTVRDLRDATARVIAGATDEAARHKQIHKSRSLRSWTDQDGAFNLKARMTVANGALVMAALTPFQDEIFKQARKSGEYATPEPYAADALMALCAAKTESAARPTRANAVMNIRVDLHALNRGHTEEGEICEIAGVGPYTSRYCNRIFR